MPFFWLRSVHYLCAFAVYHYLVVTIQGSSTHNGCSLLYSSLRARSGQKLLVDLFCYPVLGMLNTDLLLLVLLSRQMQALHKPAVPEHSLLYQLHKQRTALPLCWKGVQEGDLSGHVWMWTGMHAFIIDICTHLSAKVTKGRASTTYVYVHTYIRMYIYIHVYSLLYVWYFHIHSWNCVRLCWIAVTTWGPDYVILYVYVCTYTYSTLVNVDSQCFEFCLQLTPEGMRFVGGAFPVLNTIILDDIQMLSDEMMVAFVSQCQTLRHVSMKGGSLLTDKAMKVMVLQSRKLKSIKLESEW